MKDWLKDKQGKTYKWVMILLLVVNGASFTLTQTGCGFLQAAQESANATRQDLDGVNEKIAEVLARIGQAKADYEAKMTEIDQAREAGDLEKEKLLIEQAKAILDGGEDLWKIYDDTKTEQKQLVMAYDNAVLRVEKAATAEEKAGSIFGTILTAGLSLFGLGGLGGAAAGAASASSSRKEAAAFRSEADNYKAGLEVTSELLDKAKELDPSKWSSLDKAPILAKASPEAHAAVKAIRKGS